MKLEHIKDLIQSCNINFLIGSGLSNPYLSTLGNIEILLTKLEEEKPDKDIANIIKASLYKEYCETVIFRNLISEISEYKTAEAPKTKYKEYRSVLIEYKTLLKSLNEILLYRHNNLLTKQINLFTTNIDLFLERALEETSLEFNDGFKGRINPIYDLGNFQKSYSKTSSHYDNISEIPVFNLLKIHGSINWEKNEKDQIFHSNGLTQVKKTKKKLETLSESELFIDISSESTFEELLEKANELEFDNTTELEEFLVEYDKLLIINPTKEKFKRTVFDEQFYELLRIYANSLEKENTLLIVLGFSFADEHIRQITVRAANSNPTLQIVILSYSNESTNGIDSTTIKNNNIHVLTPQGFINANIEEDDKKLVEGPSLKDRLVKFNSKSINDEIFSVIKRIVRH